MIIVELELYCLLSEEWRLVTPKLLLVRVVCMYAVLEQLIESLAMTEL